MTQRGWTMGMASLLLAAALPGCAGEETQPAPTAAIDPAFVAAQAGWRRERRDALLAPDGWTSLIGLHWIELPAHYVGSSADSGLRLALGPPKLGLLQRERRGLFLTPERGVALTLDGAPLAARAALRDDRDPAPSVVGFDDGRGTLSVIHRGGREALRVRHADAPTRTGFGRLDYWPADPGWRIDADFRPNPAGTTIEVANLIGGVDAMPSPGVVSFVRDGVDYRLAALAGADGGLFLILADGTTGHDTYGAGRYIDTGAPANGRVVVDFNRAYNPPCAFTRYATCPLPPDGNRLSLPVTAGERTYVPPASPTS